MRLIDAAELEEKAWRFGLGTREDVVNLIRNAPTVEPKRGHWIDDWDIGCSVCSECDDSFLWEDFNGVREFNYCPTCGAKMDEVT